MRGLKALHGAALGLVLAMVPATALATPIQPDVKKLLEPPPGQNSLPGARAGWNGSEAGQQPRTNPVLEKYSQQAASRAAWQEFKSIAVPDWRLVIALIALIFLLRQLKQRDDERAALAHAETPPLEKAA